MKCLMGLYQPGSCQSSDTGQSPLFLRMSRSSCVVELTSSGALFLLPYSFMCFSICIFPLEVLNCSLFVSQKLDKSQLRNTAPAYQYRSSGAVLELVLSPVFLRSTDKGLPRLGLLRMEQLEASNILIYSPSFIRFPMHFFSQFMLQIRWRFPCATGGNLTESAWRLVHFAGF